MSFNVQCFFSIKLVCASYMLFNSYHTELYSSYSQHHSLYRSIETCKKNGLGLNKACVVLRTCMQTSRHRKLLVKCQPFMAQHFDRKRKRTLWGVDKNILLMNLQVYFVLFPVRTGSLRSLCSPALRLFLNVDRPITQQLGRKIE